MSGEKRPCPSTYTIPGTGTWVRCHKPRGHEGNHEAEVNGETVTWSNH